MDKESKVELENLEDVTIHEQGMALFPLLRGKTPEELEALNKSVLRKLDWYFLPCVTMMLLMRSVRELPSYRVRNGTNSIQLPR